MAVYTKVTKNNLNNFLMNYDIGILKNFEEIAEGVENTNVLNRQLILKENIFQKLIISFVQQYLLLRVIGLKKQKTHTANNWDIIQQNYMF